MDDRFDDIQASYGRCLRQNQFIDRFYEILMDSHPDIQPMFQRTHFGQQRKALRRGISIALSFASGSASVLHSMNEMAAIHSRNGHAPVEPAYYRYWLDSLIQALEETDPRFNPKLEQRWRLAMEKTTEYFSKHYDMADTA